MTIEYATVEEEIKENLRALKAALIRGAETGRNGVAMVVEKKEVVDGLVKEGFVSKWIPKRKAWVVSNEL